LVLSLFATANWAATIVAALDRNPVAVNESFTVTFDAQGDLDDDPDFSPLETWFDILNRSQSSRVQIINGRMDSTKQWQLTLMAREPGRYTLPAIEFGKDRSNPLELEVRDAPTASSTPDSAIFLETELTPEAGYVQAQLVYTLRLLRSVNLRSGSLSEPEISGVEVIVEKLGEDRTFETQRNGIRYVVLERSYAIFPQQSGTLVVEPTVFQGQIISRGSRFLFDENVQAKRLKSEAFSIEVKPVPAQAARPWLPAHALRLQEEWVDNPPRFRVGEPVTRTLTLAAEGIAAAQLPSLARTLPDGLKQYPDQPVVQDDKRSNGLFGIRQEKVAIMPSVAGRYELPAIEVPWWNIETGQQEIARIPARSIDVTAAAEQLPAPALLPSKPLDVSTVTPSPQTTEKVSAGYWRWISGALALGWMLTALSWWRTRRVPEQAAKAHPPAADFKAVKKACRQNDARACKTALLGWAQSQWPRHPPTSLSGIATRVDTKFAHAITILNRVLYASEETDWQGAELLAAAQQWLKISQASRAETRSAIAPLRPY
jgi:hypothetical protein